MLGLLVVVALIAANAAFVAAEFAIVAVDRSRVEQQAATGKRSAKTALQVLKRLSFNLSGAQLGITISSLVLGFVAEPTMARVIEPVVGEFVGGSRSLGVSIVIALTLATTVQMVMGELVPKTYAIAKPLRTAYALSAFLKWWGILTGPLLKVLNGSANMTVRRFGIEPREELASVRSLEELDLLIRSSAAEGTLDQDALMLVTRSIRLADKTVADALVPRLAVHAMERESSIADLAALAVEIGRSRFPVYHADLDDVIGIVHAKDVYSVPYAERSTTSLDAIMRDAFFVPESRELGSLLLELRDIGTHMAIVVDEYGGTKGIITLEDVLEEVVGEIDDEYDVSTPLTSLQRPGEWILEGTLHPDEVFDACGFEIPEGPYETLAGFVVAELGHIGEPGEVIEHQGWMIEVTERDRLRVSELRVVAPVEAVDHAAAPSAGEPSR